MGRLHGNAEECNFDAFRGRVLHLGVLGYRPFTNVRILCDVTLSSGIDDATGDGEYASLVDNRWEVISGSAGDVFHYRFEVPPGTKSVKIRTKSGNGNVDLYASFDHPTVIGPGENESNICVRKGSVFTSPTCSGQDLAPLGSVLYVSLYAVADIRNVRIKVRT